MSPAELAAVHAASFETPRPWSADEFAALLTMPGAFLVPDPAGFALGRVVLDEAELLTIAVAPAARRRGIGRRLLDGFETEARRRGALRAFLEVSAENPAALALYRAAGYGQDGTRRGYYRTADGRRVDAAIFSKALPPGATG